ncbi:MAG: hypothetical protein SFZ23_11915 [Planctomycetota bacterium]|nr:hypothetical protein [Planctomycetota bacterium]
MLELRIVDRTLVLQHADRRVHTSLFNAQKKVSPVPTFSINTAREPSARRKILALVDELNIPGGVNSDFTSSNEAIQCPPA